MTENGTWTEEHILASDLWAIGKSMEPMSAEEELEAWRKTVGALDSLCGMADALMLEPLILALVDASGRSREELRRAEDRVSRPEGADLTVREEERLRDLMRRSNALRLPWAPWRTTRPPTPESWPSTSRQSGRSSARRTKPSRATVPKSASPTR